MLHNNKHIAVILSDNIQSIGLQWLLTEYFPPVEICLFSDYSMFNERTHDSFDFYFTDTETFLLNHDFFLPRKGKTMLITRTKDESSKTTSLNYICINDTLETIIDRIEDLFAVDTSSSLYATNESNKELSSREVEVLQLIVKGITNKEIADKLRISLNTVLTHRKNITSKLGIKTVSGLTFYAIMNGLVAGEEIEL